MKKIYFLILFTIIILKANAQTKHVLFEEFTGSWCGYCVDGHARIDTLQMNYPGLIFPIAYHSEPGLPGGEPMETPISLQFANDYLVSGFPSAMTDRNPFQGNPVIQNTGYWIPRASMALNNSTVVDIGINHNYNAATRLSDGTVNITLYGSFVGNLFVNIMYVEDNVVGTGNGYNQSNYYNNVVGHPFYGMGNPIVGYHHMQVFRESLTGVYGDSTVVPAGVSSGTYNLPFSYTVDSNFNPAEMKIVAFVSRKLPTQTNQQSLIENVYSVPVLTFTGIEEHQTETGITEITPNPSSSVSSVSFLITNNEHVKLEIYNALGSRVLTISNKKYSNGIYREYADVSTLPPGVYLIKMEADLKTMTRKLIITR